MENFSCPICHCHDRERHLLMYFDELDLWHSIANQAVLHIAPENTLKRRISDLKPSQYIQGDYAPASTEIEKIDICELPYSDNTFDFILCNHVLEHVSDDVIAMQELFRVLKIGGFAVIQTPFSAILANTFVDANITSDELRRKFYGQEDHVRVFGNYLFSKLENTRF